MVPTRDRGGLTGLEVQQDLGPADWLRPMLSAWGSQAGPPTVGSFVPALFESYARILRVTSEGVELPIAAVLVRPLLGSTSASSCCYGIWDGYGDLQLAGPTFETFHRRYWLLRGPVEAAAALRRAPDLWWPEDRAWFLGGDTDLKFSYLGASSDVISGVLRDEWLRADRAEPDDRVDAAGEPPFRPTP